MTLRRTGARVLLLVLASCAPDRGAVIETAPSAEVVETTTSSTTSTTTTSSTTTTTTTSTTSTTVARPPTTVAATRATTATTRAATGACDPNYSGACVPIDSDVDCAGGTGDGPSYVSAKRFQVVGRDIYRLDSDGDGIACES